MTTAVTVVIGSKNARATAEACLESVCAQAMRIDTQILYVEASTAGPPEFSFDSLASVVCIEASPTLLVPDLWALGLSKAKGAVVAFTTADCVPAGDWLESIFAALENEPQAAAVGGPIEPPEGGSGADWALYFTRYSAYLPPVDAHRTRDLAGDNAAYRRADLDQCVEQIANGFWETLVPPRLEGMG